MSQTAGKGFYDAAAQPQRKGERHDEEYLGHGPRKQRDPILRREDHTADADGYRYHPRSRMTASAPLARCQCGAEGERCADGWTRFFGQDFCSGCWQEKQRIEAENRERHFREEKERKQSWKVRYAEVADCPRCSKNNLRVRLPRDGRYVGDGTLYITYWHKSLKTGQDCRAEVDVEDVRFVERAARLETTKSFPSQQASGQTSPSEGDCLT